MIGHPGEQRLLGFLDGHAADTDRQRIARHLAGCQRCRDVVQGYRALRGVLRLEPPPAPGGVLGRILDSREAGMAVVLPAVDPEPGRAGRPGYLTLLVSAAAVLVVALVQLVPASPFQAAWQWWSRAVAEWRPAAAGGAQMDLRELLRMPVAKPAELDGRKLRPITARYRTIRPGRRSAPDTFRFGFALTATANDDWLIEPVDGSLGRYLNLSDLVLDGQHLSPRSWRYERGPFRDDSALITSMISIAGRWKRIDNTLRGDPSPGTLRFYPPGLDSVPIPATLPQPFTLGGEAVLAVQLMGADLKDGWSGAVGNISSRPVGDLMSATSYLVEGSATITTPAGRFDAWQIRAYGSNRGMAQVFWLRKSDGLLVRTACPALDPTYCGVTELVSVSNP